MENKVSNNEIVESAATPKENGCCDYTAAKAPSVSVGESTRICDNNDILTLELKCNHQGFFVNTFFNPSLISL